MEKIKNKYLNDVFEIVEEFSKVSSKKYSSSELISSADELLKIAKGKITKRKLFEKKPRSKDYASDTYIKMTEDPWSSYHDFNKNVLAFRDDDYNYSKSLPTFQQINEGWV